MGTPFSKMYSYSGNLTRRLGNVSKNVKGIPKLILLTALFQCLIVGVVGMDRKNSKELNQPLLPPKPAGDHSPPNEEEKTPAEGKKNADDDVPKDPFQQTYKEWQATQEVELGSWIQFDKNHSQHDKLGVVESVQGCEGNTLSQNAGVDSKTGKRRTKYVVRYGPGKTDVTAVSTKYIVGTEANQELNKSEDPKPRAEKSPEQIQRMEETKNELDRLNKDKLLWHGSETEGIDGKIDYSGTWSNKQERRAETCGQIFFVSGIISAAAATGVGLGLEYARDYMLKNFGGEIGVWIIFGILSAFAVTATIWGACCMKNKFICTKTPVVGAW